MLINPSDIFPVLIKEEEETETTIRSKKILHTYATPTGSPIKSNSSPVKTFSSTPLPPTTNLWVIVVPSPSVSSTHSNSQPSSSNIISALPMLHPISSPQEIKKDHHLSHHQSLCCTLQICHPSVGSPETRYEQWEWFHGLGRPPQLQ